MNAQVSALQVGDWIDVVDDDGIWNVAQVLHLPTLETVEVTYDCWGDEYNEVLRRDSDRIAPYHTHTWAVKCWVKLATWPWWPALTTVRAPGSALGIYNLKLEERLLVDFLDRPEFTERSRCWVKKSSILAFQSNKTKILRHSKSKTKRKKGMTTEARSKSLACAMTLLAKCDAGEDFPEFVEGTLPVKFEHHFTMPTEELRKELGEEIWMRSFANNRVHHAATHAYTLSITEDSESNNEYNVGLLNSIDKTDVDATRARDISPNEGVHSFLLNAGTVPKNPKKRVEDNTLESIIFARTETATSPGKQSQVNCTNAPHYLDFVDTAKLQRNSAKRLDRHQSCRHTSPHYARVIARSKPRDKEHTVPPSHSCDAPQPRLRVQKGVLSKVLPASDHDGQQPDAAMRSVLSCDSEYGDEITRPMKSLARLTIATLQADEKLRKVEAALERKLNELADKAVKAEELRTKCAALPKLRGDSQVSSLMPCSVGKTQGVVRENLPLGSSRHDSIDVAEVPTFAKRLSQSKIAARGLELALDDVVSRKQGQNLSAATTPAELNAIKAELLRSPQVQAAINRMERPSYGWMAPTGVSYRERSLLLNGSSGCSLKEVKSRYLKYLSVAEQSVLRSSQRSLSLPTGRSWGYDRGFEAYSEQLQGLSTCSVLSGPPPAGQSIFDFSVNDNFSINQWYQDLYPKSFGFERPL
ncbi:unnamed protein product [Peronospora belbahrii]|uniref:PWWP domain-containing protein n=1 Tax=Peronospora belbahrii TaxID=622444 RepID=A0AAU9L6S2_9STRA|nr:unnamed protein product [Peronospora belbahrii]